MPVDRSQLRRVIDSMERALSIMEANQEARQDAFDKEFEEDCRDELAEGNTLPVPQQPFADGLHGGSPEKIHGVPDAK